MAYDGRGNITSKDGQSYSYSTANANSIGLSPHQVRDKGAQTFQYDDNGNNTLTIDLSDPVFVLYWFDIEIRVVNHALFTT